MGYTVTSGPTSEPITIEEAKQHLRVDFPDDDLYISDLISAARWKLERSYRTWFLTQTVVHALDFFGEPERMRDVQFPVAWWPPAGFQYPINQLLELRPPVQSITSIQYIDPSGNTQTVNAANYLLDAISDPCRISPILGQNWPITGALPNAVTITYVAGFTSASAIPQNILMALKLLLGVWYENREDAIIGTRLVALPLPQGVVDLMGRHKHWLVR